MIRKLSLALMALTLLAFGASSASALTISMLMTSVKNVGNTPDSNVTPNGNVSTTSVTDTGGTDATALVGDSVNGAGRMFGGIWRDTGNANPAVLTVNYRITLTMTADPGLTYNVAFTHDLEGVAQIATPGFLNNTCDGCNPTGFSNVTGTVVNSGGGSLSGSLTQATALVTTGNDAEVDVLVTPSAFTLSGIVGSQVIAVDFTFTTTVRGTNSNDCSSVRFGVPFGTGLANECEYGSSSSGTGDGHFVTATATVVALPEPGVAMLLGLGLAGLSVAGRRQS